MKKFWIVMLSAVLLSTSVSARPYGRFHPRPPRHERVVIRPQNRTRALVAGVVGGIVGGLLWENRYQRPQPAYVSVPRGESMCSTVVANGVVVQNCTQHPANVVYF